MKLFLWTITSLLSLSVYAAPLGREEAILHTREPYLMDANAGILVGGDALPGFDMQIRARLNTAHPLYLGGELGLFVYSERSFSGVVVPMLLSLSTEFATNSPVYPTIGVAAGPAISSGDFYSTARMMLMFNPGINVDLGRGVALQALARLGVLGSTFVALPQLGLLFAI